MESLKAIGLMSGTSLDGMDAALVITDGKRAIELGPMETLSYDPAFRQSLKGVLNPGVDKEDAIARVARDLTLRHAEIVKRLLDKAGLKPAQVDIIGFHGHTILHRPDEGLTRQIGDGALLAGETGIDVIDDFRSADMAAGGQGAPLAPLFHAALTGELTAELEKPVAVLNVGGVANVTYIGEEGGDGGPLILAFDTGPGNALVDDWVAETMGRPMDEGGRLARGGKVDEGVLATLLDNTYFGRPPPKSLDREDFSTQPVAGLSAADGAATLTEFTAASVKASCRFFPSPPRRWLVTGGGRHNRTLMEVLARQLGQSVEPVETVGWQGDFIEAQAFAYLAVRSLRRLPLSLPTTTGVSEPVTGGVLHKAAGKRL